MEEIACSSSSMVYRGSSKSKEKQARANAGCLKLWESGECWRKMLPGFASKVIY
jgi:hypothetical protein